MALPQDARERGLSYMRHQGAKGLADLAALMERTGAECAEILRDVGEEQASFHFDDEWSIKDVLAHVMDATRSVNEEIAALAAGRPTRPPSGIGRTPGTEQPIEELRRELATLWADTARLAASLPEYGDRGSTREHPWFGPLNYREWIAFQRVHARDHLQQIESVKAHPDYPSPKAPSTSSGQE